MHMLQIRPISDLRNNFTTIEQIVSNGSPVYLTKNGYGTMVVMSIEAYGRLTDNVEFALDVADSQAESGSERLTHKEVFSKIPAGKSMHHSFLNGLLMHTSNMLRMADFLASLYSDILNRDLLLTGTLLHDLAKEQEFICSELGLVTEYSVKGQLLGHLVMGAQEVAEISPSLGIPENKSILVQHMILSHHGDPEFGAAVVPCFAESELLSYIDNVDSRMEIYAEQYEQMETNSFSSRIFALDKKIFKHD